MIKFLTAVAHCCTLGLCKGMVEQIFNINYSLIIVLVPSFFMLEKIFSAVSSVSLYCSKELVINQ